MKDHKEVFSSTYETAHEIKPEYGWILPQQGADDHMECGLTFEQLCLVFPEWWIVLALKIAGQVPGRKACYAQGDIPPAELKNHSPDDELSDDEWLSNENWLNYKAKHSRFFTQFVERAKMQFWNSWRT